MSQEFFDDSGFGDEGNDAELTSAVGADQRVGEVDPPDELSPSLAKSGTLFWREVGFVLGHGGSVGTERLKDEACFLPVNPCSRRIGAEISHPMCSRLGNLGEDSRNKLQYVEGLAFRMGEQRVVVGAFAPVE